MELTWEETLPADGAEHKRQDLSLHGLGFGGLSASSDERTPRFSSDTRLRFRAFVETHRVPFYLVYGPRLVVYTSNAETEETLWKTLVANQLSAQPPETEGEADHDREGSMQEVLQKVAVGTCPFESDIGILLETVSDGGSAAEVLLYAASDAVASGKGAPTSGLITPPRSSSPTFPRDHSESPSLASHIRIFAQPLRSSSALSQILQQPPSPPSPTKKSHARFLSFSKDDSLPTSPPRKRPKLDNVFSAASSATRRAHRAGGKSVSQLMARPRASSTASGGNGLTRSFTTGSLPMASTSKGNSSSRPGSRAGSVSSASHAATQPRRHQRGPSLHRIASSASASTNTSAAALAPLTIFSSSAVGDASGPEQIDSAGHIPLQPPPSAMLAPEIHGGDEPPRDEKTTIEEVDAAAAALARSNKAALSRVVLAALRMWGHAPPPKREPQPLDEEREGEEDFKALYHATYSAARFALRHPLRREPLAGEAMRGIVERVLGVFFFSTAGGSGTRGSSGGGGMG